MQRIDASELIKHLTLKKNGRTTDWQDQTDSAVDLLCSEYNRFRTDPITMENEKQRSLALCYLTLVDAAAAAGNQKAKKRNLDISMWFEQMPASVWEISDDPLLRASILRTVSKKFAKRFWYEIFITTCLRNAPTAQDAISLAEIIFSTLGEKDSVWRLILNDNNAPKSIQYQVWFDAMLDRMHKKVKASASYFSKELAQNMIELISNSTGSDYAGDIKIRVLEVIHAGLINRPVFYLSESHLKLLWSCKPSNPVDIASKPIYKKVFDKLTQSIIDIPTLPCEPSTVQYLVDVWMETARLFYGSESAAISRLQTPHKAGISHLVELSVNPKKDIDDVEDMIAELSACWTLRTEDCFRVSPSLRNIDGILSSACERYEITEISCTGESIEFDPITHHLIDECAPAENRLVRVVRPGYVKRRQNGSLKVIKKALVEVDK